MKRFLLSVAAALIANISLSQVVVVGVSPASVQGNYTYAVQTHPNWPNYTAGQFPDSENWGLAMNFNNVGSFIQDTLVLVNDGSSGTDPVLGNPVAEEGCNPSPANAYEGKIAVLRRNTCNFVLKALYAQQAGAVAVIIIDNINDDNLANNFMSAAMTDANGPLVTIPVVRISLDDGNHLISEMDNGPVVMFIGNKAGAFPNDVALNHDFIFTPTYHGVNSLLSQDASEFSLNFGARVYNSGSTDQASVKLTVKVTNPAGIEVYNEEIVSDIDTYDSLEIFPGETLNFPPYSQATYENGEFIIEYEVALDGGVTDDFASDNYYKTSFVMNDSYFSRSRLDPTTLKPAEYSMTRSADPAGGGTYSEVLYCSSFTNANASRVAVTGIEAAVGVDSVDASSTVNGMFTFLQVYEWTNASAVFDATTNLALTTDEIVSKEFNLEGTGVSVNRFFDLDEPLILEDAKVYLFCLADYGQTLRVGFDREVDFNVAYQFDELNVNPLKVVEGNTATWYKGGFGTDITPSYGIKVIDAESVGIQKLSNLEGSVYPNPASDAITMNIALDGKATVEITDLSGRIVATENVNFVSNNASLNISNLKEGMFIANVIYNNGAKTTFNFIKK